MSVFDMSNNYHNSGYISDRDEKQLITIKLESNVTSKKYDVDIFIGVGGGPEGVLAAAALDAFNCNFQGRFLFKSKKDILIAKKMGIKDLNKKYDIKEIIKGESLFCATGITDGDLVKGVLQHQNKFFTETLVTHKNNSINIVKSEIANT